MARLDELPAELIEHIVTLLTLNEICALRLANRSLASKASQDHFRAFYRSKRVDIDEHGLKDFVVCTANNGMGCLIDDFTLTGLVYNTLFFKSYFRTGNIKAETCEQLDGGRVRRISTGWRAVTDEERDIFKRQLNTLQRRQEAQLHFLQSEDAQRLLIKAFRNIRRGRTSQRPLSLTLDLAVYRDDALLRTTPAEGGSWRLIWQSAIDTFQLVQDALDASMLPVHHLRLFPTQGRNGQLRSSLTCNEIGPVITYSGLENCLANLKALTISFSDVSLRFSDKDAELMEASDKHELRRQPCPGKDLQLIMQAADPNNFAGLLSFIKACRNLEELDLHRCQLTHDESISNVQGDKVSHMLFHNLKLPRLRDVKLRGFRAGQDDTITFLQSHPRIEDLLLKNFTLSSGTFQPIFTHLTGNPDSDPKLESRQAALKNMLLEDLFEYGAAPAPAVGQSRHLLVFTPNGNEDDFEIGGVQGGNKLLRQGEGIKRSITYRTQDHSAIGRGWNHLSFAGNWRQWQKEAFEGFGPPDQKYR